MSLKAILEGSLIYLPLSLESGAFEEVTCRLPEVHPLLTVIYPEMFDRLIPRKPGRKNISNG